MEIRKKIKVLVVDDSLIFREMIAKGIALDKSIEVVGTASDPFMARDKIIELEPDVLTLDVEMPKMSGIEFLKRLMPQYPLPVVVVSSVSESVFDALNAGAVDFVTKPDSKNGMSMESLINELVVKIKIASTAHVGHWKNEHIMSSIKPQSSKAKKNMVIAIGASTGGTEALYNVMKSLPKDIPGIVVVQHMPPVFTRMFADRLNNSCLHEVREAKTGDVVLPGTALIAPGDAHMKLKKAGDVYSVECFQGEKVNGHCPSVDVLFDSVAEKAKANSIGVILTGMGYDGAKGLLKMRKSGARTLGQDEETCVVYGMPKVAFDLGAVERQVPLGQIAHSIYSLLD